jgi:hypothetical protein
MSDRCTLLLTWCTYQIVVAVSEAYRISYDLQLSEVTEPNHCIVTQYSRGVRQSRLICSSLLHEACSIHSASHAAPSCSCRRRRCCAFCCCCFANAASCALLRTPRMPSALPMRRLATAVLVFGRGAGGASCFAGMHRAASDAYRRSDLPGTDCIRFMTPGM